jgi:hypothetical protein
MAAAFYFHSTSTSTANALPQLYVATISLVTAPYRRRAATVRSFSSSYGDNVGSAHAMVCPRLHESAPLLEKLRAFVG